MTSNRCHLTTEQKHEMAMKLRKEGYKQKEIAEMVGYAGKGTVLKIETGNKLKKKHTSSSDLRYKIKPEHEEEILKKSEEGETQEQIASSFGITTHRVRQILKKIKKRKEPREKQNELTIPLDEFNIIYADPPWMYKFSKDSLSLPEHYPVMELNEICALGEKLPIAEDAILFLQVTMPKLEDAFHVIKSWGFKYKTGIVWVKDKKGTGYYCRNKHELLLIATKGDFKPPLPEICPDSVIIAPRTEHSKKQEIIYEIIEKMYPQGKYLELFAREKREGVAALKLGWKFIEYEVDEKILSDRKS